MRKNRTVVLSNDYCWVSAVLQLKTMTV